MKNRMYVLGICAGLLVGCGSGLPTQSQISQDGLSFLREAKPIPKHVGQAISLSQQFEVGKMDVTDVAGLYANTLIFNDIYGTGFVQLVTTTPVDVKDPIAFGLTLKGDEHIRQPQKWFTSIVGATTARNFISAHMDGAVTLMNLAKTVSVIGAANVAGYVAFSPEALTIKDKAGNYWDLSTQTKVAPERVKEFSDTYATLVRKNTDEPEVRTYLTQSWSTFTSGGGGSQTVEGPVAQTINDYRDAQGNLNFQKAATQLSQARVPSLVVDQSNQALQPLGSGLAKQSETFTQDCWRFLWWNVCGNQRYEGTWNALKPTSGGWLQNPNQYADSSTTLEDKYYNMPVCASLTGATSKGPLGCAGSSLAGVVYWLWRYDNARFDGKAYDGSAVATYWKGFNADTPMANLGKRQSTGRALVQDLLGTCTIQNYGLTYPWKYVEGVNKYFAKQYNDTKTQPYPVKLYNMTGTTRSAANPMEWLPWANASYSIAAHVRDGVGKREFPTVALYQVPGGSWVSLHYSIVTKYRVIYAWNRANTFVSTVDHPDALVNITDPWLAFSGAYTVR